MRLYDFPAKHGDDILQDAVVFLSAFFRSCSAFGLLSSTAAQRIHFKWLVQTTEVDDHVKEPREKADENRHVSLFPQKQSRENGEERDIKHNIKRRKGCFLLLLILNAPQERRIRPWRSHESTKLTSIAKPKSVSGIIQLFWRAP